MRIEEERIGDDEGDKTQSEGRDTRLERMRSCDRRGGIGCQGDRRRYGRQDTEVQNEQMYCQNRRVRPCQLRQENTHDRDDRGIGRKRWHPHRQHQRRNHRQQQGDHHTVLHQQGKVSPDLWAKTRAFDNADEHTKASNDHKQLRHCDTAFAHFLEHDAWLASELFVQQAEQKRHRHRPEPSTVHRVTRG